MIALSPPEILHHAGAESPAPQGPFAQGPHPLCRTSVIVPARNEEHSLPATLDALRLQVAPDGKPLPPDTYEVLVLLNNCTDRSAEAARRYAEQHPAFRLHIAEIHLAPAEAHVGTARSILMDAACARLETFLEAHLPGTPAILSTDADTLVAPDWIAANRAHLEAGAEVVGGVIHLLPHELEALDPGTREAYRNDRAYQHLVARLESLLDPDPADPWPRHLEHFGASLACTCPVYRRSGGMPAVKPLEDVAFIDALRKVGAHIRHAVDVHIYTSARLDGRAEVGLSGQLRHWRADCAAARPHQVESAEWLEHRFRSLRALRLLHRAGPAASLEAWPAQRQQSIRQALETNLSEPKFLERIDCNALIEQTFAGPRHAPIEVVLVTLTAAVDICRPAPAKAHGA